MSTRNWNYLWVARSASTLHRGLKNWSCTTDACYETGFFERQKIQLEEARAVHEMELERLEREARLIARRTCNANGIYE